MQSSMDPRTYKPFDIGPARYRGCGVIAIGMTGRVLHLSATRVVKVARIFPPPDDEYTNASNREALKNEKAIYDRLGAYDGIIHCFKAADDGIELEYANQGDLRSYIETGTEPQRSTKIAWGLTLAKALSYIHARRVLVDEIALRNILVHNGQLKFADFGQSFLLAEETDMDTICEEDLTVKIEIYHLGWILYSLSVWQVHEVYCFNPAQSNPIIPPLDGLLFADIIQKCWDNQYGNVNELQKDVDSLT